MENTQEKITIEDIALKNNLSLKQIDNLRNYFLYKAEDAPLRQDESKINRSTTWYNYQKN